MKHNDKAWQDDNSARLDALLSDFLDKDITMPVEPRSSHPTSAPLGDLFPEVGSATEATSRATSMQAPAVVQKVAPVNRTEVWEATNRMGRPAPRRGTQSPRRGTEPPLPGCGATQTGVHRNRAGLPGRR